MFRSQLTAPPTKQDLILGLLAKCHGTQDVVRKGTPAEKLSRLPMVDVARECLHWSSSGSDIGTCGDADVVRAAFSGGELAGAFDGIFGSTLAGAYGQAECKSAGWTWEERELENYSATRITRVLDNVMLLPRGRGEVAALQSLLGYSVAWSATEYAKSLIIDEQDLVNDHTKAILQAAAGLGRGAIRLRDDGVFSMVLANPVLPSDNLPVFDPGHNNYLSGPDSALSNTSLAQGIAAIRSQVIDTPDGRVHLELAPKYLIVPPSLENQARQAMRLQKLDNDKTDLELIVTSRLSSVGVADPLSGVVRQGNDTNWLLTADSRTAPSFAVGFLRGLDTPKIRSAELPVSGNFSGLWARSWDVQMSLAVAAIDFRGSFWSPGW